MKEIKEIKFLGDKEINKIVGHVRSQIILQLNLDEEEHEQELDFLAEDIVIDLLYEEETQVTSNEEVIDMLYDLVPIVNTKSTSDTILYITDLIRNFEEKLK